MMNSDYVLRLEFLMRIRLTSILHSSSLILHLRILLHCQIAELCTPATARPEGSFMFFQASSHSSAMAVEQATLAS